MTRRQFSVKRLSISAFAALPLFTTSAKSAANSCTTYTYVGVPFDTGGSGHPLVGNVTASVTLPIPANYTGTLAPEGVVGFTVNPNNNIGLTISYPSPNIKLPDGTSIFSCVNSAFNFFSLSNGVITSWAFDVYNYNNGGNNPYPLNMCKEQTEVWSDEVGTTNPAKYIYDDGIPSWDIDDHVDINVPPPEYQAFVTKGGAGTWTLSSVNSPPVAADQAVNDQPNQPVTIDLTVGSACGGDVATITRQPTQGKLSGLPNTTIVYTPNPGAAGADSFQFTLGAGSGTSNVATAQITMLPTAANETASVQGGTPIEIFLTNGSQGDPTSAQLVGAPVGGTVTGFPNTFVQFTPDKGSTIAAGFNFTLANSIGTSNTASATVWPTIVSAQTKYLFSQLAGSFDQVSDFFEYASIVAEGPSNLKKNVAIFVANHVLNLAIAGNDELLGQKVDFITGSAEFAAFSVEKLTKTNVVSLPLEVDSLIFKLAAIGSNTIANDPPDPNYKKVFEPQSITFPKTGNIVADQVESDYLNYMSLSAANVHAAERWQGATLAKADSSATEQKAAYKTYSGQLTRSEKPLNADNTNLANALPPVDISVFPGGAAAIATAYNEQCGRPLPHDMNERLLRYKLSQATIDALVCQYVAGVNELSVNTSFGYALTTPLPN